ncbi:MAG: Fe2+-dependent dioxygenase [Pseudomonadota bacterium]
MRKLLANDALFESGSQTAGRKAKLVKSNQQGIAASAEISSLVEKIKSDLSQHPTFKRMALPAQFGRVLISRYEAGMSYGSHFDNAFIEGLRTDLSFTVFLSEHDAYEGGELEIHSPMGQQAIKLPAGCAIIYPSNQLHAVRPVTRGTRLCAVGWLQSRVRCHEKRQLLYDLDTTTAHIESSHSVDADKLLTLKHIRNNLVRMWSD